MSREDAMINWEVVDVFARIATCIGFGMFLHWLIFEDRR
jgi:hypothetical protein